MFKGRIPIQKNVGFNTVLGQIANGGFYSTQFREKDFLFWAYSAKNFEYTATAATVGLLSDFITSSSRINSAPSALAALSLVSSQLREVIGSGGNSYSRNTKQWPAQIASSGARLVFIFRVGFVLIDFTDYLTDRVGFLYPRTYAQIGNTSNLGGEILLNTIELSINGIQSALIPLFGDELEFVSAKINCTKSCDQITLSSYEANIGDVITLTGINFEDKFHKVKKVFLNEKSALFQAESPNNDGEVTTLNVKIPNGAKNGYFLLNR
ncbi:MAG: hypothetical protein HC836_27735 [Richelia sp. RM2_1_2]|nr:hypothetical protein [Richelia sp. RM2_1_2]